MAAIDYFAESLYDSNQEFFGSADTTSSSSHSDVDPFGNNNDDMLNEIFSKPQTKRFAGVKKSIAKKSAAPSEVSKTSTEDAADKPKTRKRTSKLAALMGDNVDPVEWKKARKRMQNRISAHKCRQRKREYLESLEFKAEQLRNEKVRVQKGTHHLNDENADLRHQVVMLQNLISSSNNEYLIAQMSKMMSSPSPAASFNGASQKASRQVSASSTFDDDDWNSSSYSSGHSSSSNSNHGDHPVDFLALDDMECFNNVQPIETDGIVADF